MTEQTQEETLEVIPTEDAGAFDPNGPGDLDVVRIYNEELDAYGESPRAGLRYLAGWVVVEPKTTEEAGRLTDYDPTAHSRDEVLAFFATAPADVVEAVKLLEAAGKNRTTVLNWEPAPEDDPTD